MEVYIPELMIESAASMLKEQHMPASVGNILKMAEQETGWPFHSQYLRTEVSPFFSALIPLTSLHGSVEYHKFLISDVYAEV